jgi:hypothetical protein
MLSSISPTNAAGQFSTRNTTLLRRLTSGQILTIAPDSMGGLLLIKPFYVDFAGPGAAVGGEFDRNCTAVYQIGTVRFQPLPTQRDRDDAIKTRITYAEQLSAILDVPHPLQRGRLIVEQLANWLPGNLSLTIPTEYIAALVVLPQTIQFAWQAPKAIAADLPVYREQRQLECIPA